MFKRFLPILVAVSLLVGVIGATSGVAFAAGVKLPPTATKSAGLNFGFQGFWSHNPNFANDVSVYRFIGKSMGVSGVKFVRPIMILDKGKDKKGDKLSGPAYVYSYLTGPEAKNISNYAWYYRSGGTGGWTKLPTRLEKGPNGDRAVAEVKGYGWYALGITQ